MPIAWHSASLTTMVLLFVGTAAGIAWFEEIVFRGYLLQNAMEGLGQTRAVVLMTVVGGLMHVLNPHAGWNSFQGSVFGLSVSGRPTDSLYTTTFTGPAWASGGRFGIEAGLFGVVWAFGGMLVLWLWCRRRVLASKPPTGSAGAP